MPVINKQDHWDDEWARLNPGKWAVRVNDLETISLISNLNQPCLLKRSVIKFMKTIKAWGCKGGC